MIQRFTPPDLKLLNLRATRHWPSAGSITTRFHDDALISDLSKGDSDSATDQCGSKPTMLCLYFRRILPLSLASANKQAGCGLIKPFVEPDRPARRAGKQS